MTDAGFIGWWICQARRGACSGASAGSTSTARASGGSCAAASAARTVAGKVVAWAALSAGGVRTFPLLSGIEALTVYADADAAGIEASRTLCRRYAGAGRFAELVRPKRKVADMADLAA